MAQIATHLHINSASVTTFLALLREELTDPRDVRGRWHSLEFPLAATVLALLSQCRTMSSIHRFMLDRLEWLRAVLGMPDAHALSRGYLPVFLGRFDWTALGALIERCFGAAREQTAWRALDGKTLRGGSRHGERQAVVFAVEHRNSEEAARLPQTGNKSSEIEVLRELLRSSGLERCKVTFDAMHCNPETLAQVAAAGGIYLVQVKENQSELAQQCHELGITEPTLAQCAEADKGHGRTVQRTASLVALPQHLLHKRWAGCRMRYLVTVVRETYRPGRPVTQDIACYVTNACGGSSHTALLNELAGAIREHWRVEANNWVRDVTFGEDAMRTKHHDLTQVMALLRSLALTLLRRSGAKNLQAELERLNRRPDALELLLKEQRFL